MSEQETNFRPEPESPLKSGFNFNSFLGLIAVTVVLWTGATVHSLTVEFAEMKGQQVNRGELETKLAEVNARQSATESKLAGIEVELAGIKAINGEK